MYTFCDSWAGFDLVQTANRVLLVGAVWKGTLYTPCGTGLLFICTLAVQFTN